MLNLAFIRDLCITTAIMAAIAFTIMLNDPTVIW